MNHRDLQNSSVKPTSTVKQQGHNVGIQLAQSQLRSYRLGCSPLGNDIFFSQSAVGNCPNLESKARPDPKASIPQISADSPSSLVIGTAQKPAITL